MFSFQPPSGVGGSRKRKNPEENRSGIRLLRSFKQTLQADHLLELLGVQLEGEEEEVPLRSSSVKELNSIQFKDLNLEILQRIEINKEGAREDEDENYFPFRNYLIGRSKGIECEKSAFTVLAEVGYPNQVCFSLEVDTNLGKKICQVFKSPSIPVRLTIKGIERVVDPLEVSSSSYDYDSSTSQKQYNFQIGSREYSFNLQELMNSNDGVVGVEDEMKKITLPLHKCKDCWGTPANMIQFGRSYDGIPLEELKKVARADNKTVTFTWDIALTFENHAKISLPKLKLNPDLLGKGLHNLDSSTKDLTIIANNKAEIKCHRIVLMVHSDPFKAMLFPSNKMLEGETGRIEMLENSADGIKRFIRFLYGFEISKAHLTPDMAVELFLLSHKYQVKKLEEFLKDFLSSKSKDWFSVDALLELYFGVRNVDSLDELNTHCLIELAKLPEETLRNSEYFKKLSIQESSALLCKVLQWR